jgi:hypothetical protein
MKDSLSSRSVRYVVIIMTVVGVVSIFPLLSRAHPANSITVVNNSSRSIRYLYLSHTNVDDWSANQLGNSTISPGQSYTLNDVSWDSSEVKLIGEDQDGCFVSGVVTTQANATWTITSDTPRSCGD